MELAQALILTNALGGLAALGRGADPITFHRRWSDLAIGPYRAQVIWDDHTLCVCLFDDRGEMVTISSRGWVQHRTGSGEGSAGEKVQIDGQVIITPPFGVEHCPLTACEGALVAHCPPRHPALLSIEVTVGTVTHRSLPIPVSEPDPYAD